MRRKIWLCVAALVLALSVILATQGCSSTTTVAASPVDSGAVLDSGPPVDAGITDAADDVFEAAAHPAFPQVPNVDGGVIATPTIVTITTAGDTPADGTDTVTALNAFSDALPNTKVWEAVSSEYHLGSLGSGVKITGPAIAAGTYTLGDLSTYVTNLISENDGGTTAPAADGHTIYLLYLPSGATFAGSGACGYHEGYPQGASIGDELAVVIRCTPNQPDETQLGQMTQLTTHEIVEAVTDTSARGYTLGVAPAEPWTVSVWEAFVGSGNSELGDLCDYTRVFETMAGAPAGGWEFQRIWSNAAAATGGDPCIPALNEPYFSVSTPEQWYHADPGSAVSIPIGGWSTAPVPNWLSDVYETASSTGLNNIFSSGAVEFQSDLGLGNPTKCNSAYAMNNGTGAQLQVTIPKTALSGDWIVFALESFHERPSPSCYPALTEDYLHQWYVGVYVP